MMFLLTFFNTDKVVKQTFQKVSNRQEKSRKQILSLVKGIVSGVQKNKTWTTLRVGIRNKRGFDFFDL